MGGDTSRPRRRRARAHAAHLVAYRALAALAGAACLAACGGGASYDDSGRTGMDRRGDARPPAAGLPTVGCQDVNLLQHDLMRGHRVAAGGVALSGRVLRPEPAGYAVGGLGFFAKSPLYVRAGAGGDIRLEARGGRVAWSGTPIGSGVLVERCRAGRARWMAYAGGFYTARRTGCVRVRITCAGRSETLPVSVGRRCGARPPRG